MKRITATLVVLVALLALTVPAHADTSFVSTSFWNQPVTMAPVDPDSDALIARLASVASANGLRLGGLASTDQKWAMPQFYATGSEKLTSVSKACPLGGTGVLQAGTTSVHIPSNAVGSPDNDGAMLLYDGNKIVQYMEFRWVSKTKHTATACGAGIYYRGSNGLEGDLPETDDVRNQGHRGIPGNITSITWAEAQAGVAAGHMLKCAAPNNSDAFRWPMTGSDGNSTDPLAMPEGAILRLRPDLDLSLYGFNPYELAIARTLQTYGCIIGDSNGSTLSLKVENLVAEGKANAWTTNGVTANSLSALTFASGVWQVVDASWRG